MNTLDGDKLLAALETKKISLKTKVLLGRDNGKASWVIDDMRSEIGGLSVAINLIKSGDYTMKDQS
tara:strand:- start:275 stop:472 length:198 start_codon:yes stop_codon:yes gene_type:complete